jgi:hypothetical protein
MDFKEVGCEGGTCSSCSGGWVMNMGNKPLGCIK